ncbi:MAG: cytochrome c3 family protein [bacterium]|nr:cytochrome c3 family protein [bacterium]
MKNRNRYVYWVLFIPCWLLVASGCKELVNDIKFNHQLHRDRGLPCEFCHPETFTEAKAGRPTMAICANCHSINTAKPSEKCLLCHTHLRPQVNPVIPQIYRNVVFSHKTHTQKYQLSCEQCHPNISQSKKIPRTHIPNMECCIACHQKGKETPKCSDCHPGWDKKNRRR